MRKWLSHKVVEAEVIDHSITDPPAVTLTTGEEVAVPANFFSRGYPIAGKDYLVRYEDGYLSWSPKKAFEEGYTEVHA